jgi:hypothetical protein
MRSLALLAVPVLVALAFAGCAGNAQDIAPTSSTSSSSSSTAASSSSSSPSSSTSSSSSSSSTGPAPNHAPTGSISAVANGTSATFTFTGTDSDHDALTWILAFGDGAKSDGTTLPATVTHDYAAAGNVTATLKLSDGKQETAYTVALSLAPEAPSTQTVTGSWTAGVPGCVYANPRQSLDYVQQLSPLEGKAWVKFGVNSTTIGRPFTATFTASAAKVVDEIDFYDAGGKYLHYVDDTGGVIQDFVPAGAAFAGLYACDPAPGSVTYVTS